jgi:diguanylate cyclase (GGDEF)-like protein
MTEETILLACENRKLQEDLRLAREELARQGALLEEARSQAALDGLTGLYNYRHFWELLAHEVEMSRRYGCPLSLLFLDVDRFKDVNDALGHTQGDAALKELAAYLKDALRHADVACRYGGEEFVIILPRTTAAQAEKLAERLRQGVCTRQLCLVSRQVQLSVSIGVAELEAGMDADSLLNAADAALYRAKLAGRNRVCGPPGKTSGT